MCSMANGVRKSTLVRKIKRSEKVFSNTDVIKAVQQSSASGLNIICVDSKYYTIPVDLWHTVLQYTGVDQGQYRPERYDCDDFSIAFKAACSRKLAVNGVGLVADVSGGHAYNLLLAHEGEELKVLFMEPQSDHLVIQNQQQYAMQSGFILF